MKKEQLSKIQKELISIMESKSTNIKKIKHSYDSYFFIFTVGNIQKKYQKRWDSKTIVSLIKKGFIKCLENNEKEYKLIKRKCI